MKNTYSLLKLIILPVIIVACSTPTESVDREAYINGTVTEIEESRILVEEDPAVNEPLENGGKKIWLTISDETKLFKQDRSGSLRKINSSDIEPDVEVKGWVKGVVADSYPQQALAEQITLLN